MMKSAAVQHHLPLLVLYITSLVLVSAIEQLNEGDESHPETDPDMGKRLYDFGLGKRAYRYVNEYKRLPMYDFGLGKRSKLYSFGLGKRSQNDDEEDGFDNYSDNEDHIPETEMYDDDSMQSPDKRARMYGFGLGKRPLYEFGLGKRALHYNFGLGKRQRLYSFGLGKRGSKMYSFGLGKRDGEEYNVDKREVNQHDLKLLLETANDDDNSNNNNTAIADSHEGMSHGDRVKAVEKRSPRHYNFGLGKREPLAVAPYNTEHHKPSLYTFGKRRQMYNFGLGKRSYSE